MIVGLVNRNNGRVSGKVRIVNRMVRIINTMIVLIVTGMVRIVTVKAERNWYPWYPGYQTNC